jgi:exonuclease III
MSYNKRGENMNIISWNCGGWSCGGFTEERLNKLLKNDLELILIQESTEKEHKNIETKFKYNHWYGDNEEKSYKGVSIFSNFYKIKIHEKFNKGYRYVIPYEIDSDIYERIILLSVWTKNPLDGTGNYQKTIFEALNYYKFSDPLIVIGDFNTGSNISFINRYNELCEELHKFNLRNCAKDTPFEYEHTFYHDCQKQYYTNDFCFVSNHLEVNYINIPNKKEWKEISLNKMRWQKLSDHCPIEINIKI